MQPSDENNNLHSNTAAAVRTVSFHAALGLVACTLIGLFFATQLYLIYLELRNPISWGAAIHTSLVNWYVWGLLAIVVVILARRFPLDGGRRWSRLSFHAACAAVVGVVHSAMGACWHWLAEGQTRTAPELWSIFKFKLIVSFHWDVLTYAAIVGFVHAIEYYRRFRDRELQTARLKAELNRARLDALRMQLNPHFLFNSLNAVSELVYEDPKLADRVITQLAALLRAVLEESEKSEVTLREELDFARKYLEIEQVRLGDRLSVRIEADPATLDMQVPSLILQPLIENAIRHGIAPREDAGLVEITTISSGGRLELLIRNSGNGRTKPDARLRPRGLGLSNVRARLAHHFGEDFRLELDESDGAHLARIVIPSRRQPE